MMYKHLKRPLLYGSPCCIIVFSAFAMSVVTEMVLDEVFDSAHAFQ